MNLERVDGTEMRHYRIRYFYNRRTIETDAYVLRTRAGAKMVVLYGNLGYVGGNPSVDEIDESVHITDEALIARALKWQQGRYQHSDGGVEDEERLWHEAHEIPRVDADLYDDESCTGDGDERGVYVVPKDRFTRVIGGGR